MSDLAKNWAEQIFITMIVFGILTSAGYISQTRIMLTTVICGAILGRVLYRWKRTLKFPVYLMASGFLIGYYFGAFLEYIILSTAFFIIGFYGSYLLHDKKIVDSVEY